MPHIKSSPTAGHTGRLKSNRIITPKGKGAALMLSAGNAITNKSGSSTGDFNKDSIGGLASWFSKLWGTSGSTAKTGTGVKGFLSTALSSGEGMMGLGSLLSVAGTFIGTLFDDSAEKQHELDTRKLDIYEELGREELRINEMKAKDAIRKTGLSTMYMGWTPKQADVPGIFEGTPGLVVGDAPSEVASNSAGIIGGNNQGMITQAKQRQV
jgi:hypothetical protein